MGFLESLMGIPNTVLFISDDMTEEVIEINAPYAQFYVDRKKPIKKAIEEANLPTDKPLTLIITGGHGNANKDGSPTILN